MYTFAGWVPLPENRSATAAVRAVAECVSSGGPRRTVNPLFLHGPAGAGKTHLVSALVGEVTRRRPELTVTVLPAGDVAELFREARRKWL